MQTRTILITGAGSGIGRGLALGLAANGHHVVASDVDAATAEGTAALVRKQGGRAESAAVDVCDDEAVALCVASLRKPVDVLVNNAGMQYVARLENFPQEDWTRLVDVMLNGACRMTRAVLPGMRERGFGRIVNMGSIHSLVASPYKSAYVAAKHALIGFSKTLALETADTDITVNTICPSYVRTALVEKQIKAQAAEHGLSEAGVISEIMLKPMPKGVFISFEELTGITEFLIGPSARNITGQQIVVDGGWTAR